MENGASGRLLLRARGLAVLRGVLESPMARDLLSLLEILDRRQPDPATVADVFGRLWEGLALEPERLLPDAWQSHLAGRLLDDENPLSLSAERRTLSPAILEQSQRDLRTLRDLFDLDAPTLLAAVEDAVPGLSDLWVPWTDPDSGA
ncbi:MAG TPA: hypothetical protein VGP38_08415, partial [Rubrobacter sp.]|nr:hypothetical protein [Rubrobacter sp.]